MQIKRKATAEWMGSGKAGTGKLSLDSGVLKQTPYSFKTRFEGEPGTNPEELIGAAHAGCFSMKLAFVLQEAGITPDSIITTATVVLEDGAITEVHLETKVKASGLDQAKFETFTKDAKENCPVSKLLKANITLKAELVA